MQGPARFHFFLLALICGATLCAQDSKPVLLSRTGGGSWSNVAELKISAKNGNPKACAQLGEMMLRGAPPEVPQDAPRAIELLEQAARGGEASAAFRLAMLLERGEFVTQDQARALAYFRAAAAGGSAEAMHNLGVAYSTGRGVKRDYVEALGWLALAKKRGAASTAADDLRAHLKSIKQAALIPTGEKRADEIEKELAQTSVLKSLPPPAPFTAGKKPEPPASAPVMQKPALNFDANPLLPAPVMPAMPRAPEVTVEDPVKIALPTGRALQWPGLSALQKLADEGNLDALAALGQIKLDGKLLVEDVPGAIEVFARGAKAGSGDCAFQLAELYSKGLRVPRDDAKAFTFMLQAARGGVRTAIYNLGALYANGTGTKADYTESLAWFIVAQHFDLDSGQAARIRDFLAKTDAKQIPVAERRAAERIKEIENVRANLPGL